jgi:hypothetical protein
MMKPSADYLLTGERFEEIDCSEAVLNLNYAVLPASVMRLGVWGVVFHLRDYPLPEAVRANAVSPPADIAYLPAWSTMTFTGVTVVELEVTPYVPSFQRGGAFHSSTEQRGELSQRWQGQAQAGAIHVYGFDCVLDHPYGYCSLRIHATGEVNLSYRPDLLVPLADLQTDPNKVGWWEVGRLRA